MASPAEQTVKQEPAVPSSSQSDKLTNIKQESRVPIEQDEASFEQFYSEVNNRLFYLHERI
jgi:hypothetical protein